jgi:hypothetical protein
MNAGSKNSEPGCYVSESSLLWTEHDAVIISLNGKYFNVKPYSRLPKMLPIVLTPAWHDISSR